ncbi:MAG: DUF4469 domain-containing protein [Spirochaetales bacterium]|nr:DUF4469 domain-containing protein [Spirochaetales bacterium]
MASDKSIRFSLKENKLITRDKAPFTARVHGYKTTGQDQIIDKMAGMNASISRQELLAVFDLFKQVVRDELALGNRVSTDLFNARVSIRGAFESAEDEYDAGRNTVKVRLAPVPAFAREVEAAARVEKVRVPKAKPELDSVYDYATVSKNAVLTAGNVAEITGGDLDCDADDPNQGVFFVPEGSTARVRADVYHKRSNRRIVFQVPNLEAGAYGLVLRRSYGGTVREGELEATVSVN